LPSTQIEELFAVANGICKASESKRREAIAKLLREFRSQFKQAGQQQIEREKTLEAAIKKAEAAIKEANPNHARLTAASESRLTDALELGQRPLIDPLLVQGVKDWGFRIFSKESRILELELQKFLGVGSRRGKRAKYTERDFRIAVAVAEKMQLGSTLENASCAIAESFGLEPESIRKIYVRNSGEAKAHLQMLDSGKTRLQKIADLR
jgi:hypothetical protein